MLRTISRNRAPLRAAATRIALALSMLLCALQASAQAPADWELRVCAPPDELPFSHRNGRGFENEIAEMVATELGARLTYDWVAFTNDLIDLHFAEGTCDVLMGVPDGFERGLNTITYYQSPYVMVYRQDADFEIGSMDDPVLAELDIGVQGLGTPPHEALRQRGLLAQVRRIYGGEEGDARLSSLVRDVASGTLDVGFTWGPVGGYFAALSDVPLVVKPVEPAFDLPSVFQHLPMTFAVRRDDVAMRARLDRAIIARWDDIQAVLADFSVPLLELPRPFLGEPAVAADALTVGVVIPMPTGGRTRVAGVNDLVGNAARLGALSAEAEANAAPAGERELQVLLASSPSPEAAHRAASALLARNEVQAIVGGVGSGQDEVLAELTERAGVPFVNVGSTSLSLRQRCSRGVFHIQPSATTYLRAMADLYRGSGAPQAWFIVYPDDSEGALLAERAEAAFTAAGDRITGTRGVAPELPVYLGVLDEAAASGASMVAVLLDPADQLTLMGQAEDGRYAFGLAPFPDPLTQTREFLAAANRYGVGIDVPRLALWDPTLTEDGAAALNERFASRWGRPFDPPAWAAYAGVTLLAEAARAADTLDGHALASALLRLEDSRALGKGTGVAFNASDHELRQPLYAVRINPDAPWGPQLYQQLAVGTVEGALPNVLPSADEGEGCY